MQAIKRIASHVAEVGLMGFIITMLAIGICVLLATEAQAQQPTIGINAGHDAAYSTAPISNNLNHHGKYVDGSDFGVPSWVGQYITFKVSGASLPTGTYTYRNDTDNPIVVTAIDTSQAWTVAPNSITEATFDRDPGGFLSSGTDAHRLGIYPPGEHNRLGPDDNTGTVTVLEAYLDKVNGFTELRLMNTQKINGSNSVAFPSSGPFTGDFNDPRIIAAIQQQTGKRVRIQIPHRWSAQIKRNWLNKLSELGVVAVISDSNEVWNTQFRQFREVGDLYGSDAQATDGPVDVEKAVLGYARRAAETTNMLADINDPKLTYTFEWQAAGSFWLDKGLRLFRDNGGNFDWMRSASVAPYYGFQDDGWVDDINTEATKGINEAVKWVDRCIAVANKYGKPLEFYECGQHFAPFPNARKSELRDFVYGDGIQPHEANYVARMGALLEAQEHAPADGATMNLYSIAHSPNADAFWGYWQSSFEETVYPRTNVVISFNDGITVPPIDPDPEPEPIDPVEPVDPCLDWNGDGILDHGDIQAFAAAYVAAVSQGRDGQ